MQADSVTAMLGAAGVLVDIISDLVKPILMDADVGHHPPMLPLICGSYATVVTSGNDYSLTMELK